MRISLIVAGVIAAGAMTALAAQAQTSPAVGTVGQVIGQVSVTRMLFPAVDIRRLVPTGDHEMKYLHTMVRVTDLAQSLDFYCKKLGLVETHRKDNEKGRFTLVFLAAPGDTGGDINELGGKGPRVELTFNWDPETYTGGRNFGHLAYEVDDIYATCARLRDSGVVINRPPRDGRMAFIRSPDNISIELLQKGQAQPPAEPWLAMPNTGVW